MHLLYVDESGDTGRHNPENHTFVLCGLMVHHQIGMKPKPPSGTCGKDYARISAYRWKRRSMPANFSAEARITSS